MCGSAFDRCRYCHHQDHVSDIMQRSSSRRGGKNKKTLMFFLQASASARSPASSSDHGTRPESQSPPLTCFPQVSLVRSLQPLAALDLLMNQPRSARQQGYSGSVLDLEMQFSQSLLSLHLKAAKKGPERSFFNKCVRTWTAMTGASPGVDVESRLAVTSRHRALHVLSPPART